MAKTELKCTHLLVGDCLEIVPTLGRFDCVVASPPFNVGAPYSLYNDNRPRGEYLTWMQQVFTVIEKAMKPDASLFLVLGHAPKNPWLEFDVLNLVRGRLHIQNRIVWVKSLAVREVTIGQFKPKRGNLHPAQCHETVYHLSKTGKVPIDRLAIGVPQMAERSAKRWGGVRCRGDVWLVPHESRATSVPKLGLSPDLKGMETWVTITEAAKRSGLPKSSIVNAISRGFLIDNGQERRARRVHGQSLAAWLTKRAAPRPKHPATFPPALAEMCIRLHGVRKQMRVLDPFAGIGSTLRACEALGVDGVGVEIDPGYVVAYQVSP